MMTREEKTKLFKSAVLDGLADKYDEELKDCTENSDCSRSHYKKLSKILGVNVSGEEKSTKLSKKAIIAIMVAAVLMLTACTAYVFKKEIAGWIEEIQGDGAWLSSVTDASNSNIIEDIYVLNYVPEGYNLTNEYSDSLCVKYVFESDENHIIFKQKPLNSNHINVDAENNDSIQIECNDVTIYFMKTETASIYIWSNDKYSFNITSASELDAEELEKILNGISVK